MKATLLIALGVIAIVASAYSMFKAVEYDGVVTRQLQMAEESQVLLAETEARMNTPMPAHRTDAVIAAYEGNVRSLQSITRGAADTAQQRDQSWMVAAGSGLAGLVLLGFGLRVRRNAKRPTTA